MKKTITTLLSMATLIASTTASAVLINFEDQSMMGDGLLNEGDIITGQTLFGATFSVTGQGMTGGVPRELMLFDADCAGGCSGQDPDIMLPGAGNILIISEDNDQMDPDDSGFGGTINVSFATYVTDITGITVDVGDSDNGPNTIEVLLDGMVVDTFILMQNLGDNNTQTASFTGLFDEFRLNLAGSGGLVSVDFTPVPLPAALPLFMTGLLGLFGMRRRSIA
jgi:hypothetical protein